jgi:uncharacterized protein (TIGR02145 family)
LNDINLEGVADPTKNNHAANKNYVDSRTYETNRELSLLYNFVDLGLPSGTLWSSCNVGANSPEESGNYYAWGELSTKPEYTKNNYRHPTISDNISGNIQYDAARANWGGDWRIPTKNEMQELLDNCSKTFTTQNGVKGYKLISKNNSNIIFLPASGYYYGSTLNGEASYGYYWTSTYKTNSYSDYCLRFYNNSSYVDYFNSYYGYSIRPVLNKFANNNNHRYIDMGLPSGLLWATCNIGAATPEAYGDYFAWGETSTKSEYTSSNNNAYNNPIFNIASSTCDVATYTNINWSIPTYTEFKELINNCETKYTNLNGINGFEFISKINGKMIFMPTVGYYDEYGIDDYYFRYWSSTNYN